MTFTLATVLLLIALVVFILAAIPFPEPYAGRLVPVGLCFLTAGLLVAGVS